MTNRAARLLAAASVLAMAAAGVAHAQDSTVLEEIVVTAQKREQQSLDVPLSLTAYGDERLNELGVQDFADLSDFTPGFLVQDQSPNNPGFVMRGITSDSTDPFSEARVSVFQDGVSISKAQGSYVELFDLERVEVAKGPQSTLFGRGALIGGVNIIQKKANPAAVDGYVTVEGGDYGYRMGEAALNLPITDAAAIRFSGRVRQRDGYVENALGGEDFQSVDTIAGRIAFNLNPTDAFNFDFIVNYQEDHPAGTAFKSGGYSPTDLATAQVLASRDPWDPAALVAPASFQNGMDLGVDRKVWSVTGLAAFELSDTLTLNSITAARRFDSEEVYDPDGLGLPILTGLNDAIGEQFSQEFRLNFDNGGRMRGFVGAGVFHEDGRARLPIQFDERLALATVTGQLNGAAARTGLPATTPAPMALLTNPAFTSQLLTGLVAAQSGNRLILTPTQALALANNLRADHVEEVTNLSELTSYDVFGDVTFDVTDRFELSAGLRYTRDEKTTGFGSRVVGGRSVLGGVLGAAGLAGSGTAVGMAQAQALIGGLSLPIVQQLPSTALPLFGLTFQPTAGNGGVVEQDLEYDGFTWRVVGRYALSDDANLYASYARGRRPEVLAVAGPAAPEGAPRFAEVEAETVDSYEIGAKTAIGGRVRLDGAVYYYDYDNFQTIEQQGTLFVTTNAGKAKAYGFEGQAEISAAPGLTLHGTYAYSHARFDGGAYDGNSFRLSPDHQVSLSANWEFGLAGGVFAFNPSYSWQSETFFDDSNDLPGFQQPPRVFVADNIQDEVQEGYGLLNLRASWTPDTYPLTLEAFVTNVTDETYIIDAGNTGDSLGLPTFIAGAPRMWGLGVTYRFQ
ncbi:TonB-dependent receptor [Phenylobacterium sp.]|uniref:TonB-dependent receptor n=1 Tax=Phenylobacterium sp. TaxID=1871053 RepID=UPI0019B85285|nr:TonB-dependent receptor [Phenylobacterium sp.]MBC7167896.1 TonB-dependent receptor [Phenylobacterium sp.]